MSIAFIIAFFAAIFALAYVLSVLFDPAPAKPKSKKKQEVVEPTGPVVNIFYGSQTGTAESFAKELTREAKRLNYQASPIDLELWSSEYCDGTPSLFLLATYGEGEPTDNSALFYDWILKEAPDQSFNNTPFAVFGLGNTQYEHYNTIGRNVDEACRKLGGDQILEIGLGDDDKNIRQDFDDWKAKLWPSLGAKLGIDGGSKAAAADTDAYKYSFVFHGPKSVADAAGEVVSSSSLESARHQSALLPLSVSRNLLSPSNGRVCLHLELDLRGSGLAYETGDHIAITPLNSPSNVAALAKRVGARLTDYVSVIDDNKQAPFPCPASVHTILSRYLDINCAPARSWLLAMAKLCRNARQAERLRYLGGAGGDNRAEFDKHITARRLSIIDLLAEFSSVSMSLHDLIELLPRLQPRYYSISSCHLSLPLTAHVTALVEREQFGPAKTFEGVCTSFLERLQVNTKVEGFIRTTTFKLPKDPATPVLLIGAGTGIAPLRGMAHELEHRRTHGLEVGHNILIFGCRTQDDFLYEQELLSLACKGSLSSVHIALSREQGVTKTYVQELVISHRDEIQGVIELGGCIFVCGSNKMAREVKSCMWVALAPWKGLAAEDFVEELCKTGRYMQDVWG